MSENTSGRERLCMIFDKLRDSNKEKIVRLAEGLLNSQKIVGREKKKLTEKYGDYSKNNSHGGVPKKRSNT